MLYLNQAVRLNFNIGVDTNTTDSIVLKYRNPQGVEGEFDTVEISDASAGDCYVDVANDVLDQAGWWVFWSYVTVSTLNYPGDQFQVEVREVAQTITTLEFVKQYLGYTDTTYDFKIAALIPKVEEDYLRIRNAPFDSDPEGNLIYPAGANVTAAEMIEYKIGQTSNSSGGITIPAGVESLRLGSFSVSMDGNGGRLGGYPKSIVSQIETFVRGL